MKSEINKVLDHFSDKRLEEILNLLKRLDSQSANNSDLLQKILIEDGHLLERLAQW